MADFNAAVPVNDEKVDALHAQDEMPKRPTLTMLDMARVYTGFALGSLLGVGMVALAFQTRASWESHRDWVVPVTVPLLVVAGLGLGFLAARLRWKELALPVGLLVLALVLTALNIIRGIATDGEDGLRDAMTIITAVLLGFSVASLMAALAWVEFRNPIRPPAPEM